MGYKRKGFYNYDLRLDLDKIFQSAKELKSEGIKMLIVVSEDKNLDFPFGIDVEDNSYWYDFKKSRDLDLIKIKKLVSKELDNVHHIEEHKKMRGSV